MPSLRPAVRSCSFKTSEKGASRLVSEEQVTLNWQFCQFAFRVSVATFL
jgi:hypothetical protein